MNPLRAIIQQASRFFTYPLTIAAVRLLAVVQTVAFPIGAIIPDWLVFALLGYSVFAAILALPPRATPNSVEQKAALRPGSYGVLVALDVIATGAVAWKSGASTIAMLPGLDAAVLGIGGAAALIASLARSTRRASSSPVRRRSAPGSYKALSSASDRISPPLSRSSRGAARNDRSARSTTSSMPAPISARSSRWPKS